MYLRSDAISSLIRGKHTVQVGVSADSHEHASNVIAVLTETHTVGRYELKNRVRFRLDPNTTCALIDFYFSDGDTVLSGEYQAPSVVGTSDEDINAMFLAGTIKFYMDVDESNNLLEAGNNTAALVGDKIGYWYSKLPSSQELTFLPNQANAIELYDLNANMRAISLGGNE